MARQNMSPVPFKKHMEAYNNFSGGLNTVSSNDNLKDNEFPDLINVDLAERGSVKRRQGMVSHLTSPASGRGQGYFRFYKPDGTFDELLAVGGKLYKNGVQLTIANLSSFQSTRTVEAVQFKDKLYIATGTKLVEYDGTSAKVVVPYTPQPLEALYIGTNALADNPNAYITDGTATSLTISGLVPSKRYGVVNTSTTFTAYVNKPTGTVEYKLEYKKYGETSYTLARNWSTSKTPSMKFESLGDYEIKLTARMQGTTTEEYYFIPQYSVHEDSKMNAEHDTSTIHSCNRLVLHWNRLILYGDSSKKDMVYISDLDRPEYFPTLGTLKFENERQEGITAVVEFRDMLVVFTPNSIQALFGKSPQDYNRVNLSSSIGCIAPQSAKVVGNYVAFLSQEGIHILKSLGYTEQRANVQKIDNQIDNIVPRETDACAIVVDGQYQITFPQQKKRLRFYLHQGVWTKDESEKLDFRRSYEWNGEVFGLRDGGEVLKMGGAYDDAGFVYTDRYTFKDYTFGEPYNPKKLKEMQLLLAHFIQRVHLNLYVYADDVLVLSPNVSHPAINENGEVVWVEESNPNLELDTGTVFGSWSLGHSAFGEIRSSVQKLRISGKCRRVRLELVHEEATPNHILGVGFIFKSKKP